MKIPKELAHLLQPILSSDPIDLTLFLALKTLFDADNYKSLNNDEAIEVLDSLCLKTRYDYQSRVFLHKDQRDISNGEKIKIFKKFFNWFNDSIMGNHKEYFLEESLENYQEVIGIKLPDVDTGSKLIMV